MFEFVGIPDAIIGLIVLTIGMGATSAKISLSGFLIAVLGLILIVHPFWETWYLFLQNAVAAVPTWAWVVVGVWIYLNAGWRFAEYKLRVAARWQTTHPILLHILWPLAVCGNSVPDHPEIL